MFNNNDNNSHLLNLYRILSVPSSLIIISTDWQSFRIAIVDELKAKLISVSVVRGKVLIHNTRPPTRLRLNLKYEKITGTEVFMT